MPAVKKVFRTKTADALPPIPFDIELENAVGDTKTLEFHAYSEPPAGALITMGLLLRVNAKGEEFLDPSHLGEAFRDTIILSERDRWEADVMGSTEWMVPGTVLGDIWQWLSEEVWERPTQPSSGSSDGRSGTGAGSTVNPPFAASTSPTSSSETPTGSSPS